MRRIVLFSGDYLCEIDICYGSIIMDQLICWDIIKHVNPNAL